MGAWGLGFRGRGGLSEVGGRPAGPVACWAEARGVLFYFFVLLFSVFCVFFSLLILFSVLIHFKTKLVLQYKNCI